MVSLPQSSLLAHSASGEGSDRPTGGMRQQSVVLLRGGRRAGSARRHFHCAVLLALFNYSLSCQAFVAGPWKNLESKCERGNCSVAPFPSAASYSYYSCRSPVFLRSTWNTSPREEQELDLTLVNHILSIGELECSESATKVGLEVLWQFIFMTLVLWGGAERSAEPWLAAAVLIIDRGLLGTSFFNALAFQLFPALKRRLLIHEAGHLYMAFKAGFRIAAYSTSGLDALLSRGDVSGTAVVLLDTDFMEVLKNEADLTRLESACSVLMAGAAAEFLFLGTVEGASHDYHQLKHFLRSRGMEDDEVEAIAQSSLLTAHRELQADQASFEKLLVCMSSKDDVEKCVASLGKGASGGGLDLF